MTWSSGLSFKGEWNKTREKNFWWKLYFMITSHVSSPWAFLPDACDRMGFWIQVSHYANARLALEVDFRAVGHSSSVIGGEVSLSIKIIYNSREFFLLLNLLDDVFYPAYSG